MEKHFAEMSLLRAEKLELRHVSRKYYIIQYSLYDEMRVLLSTLEAGILLKRIARCNHKGRRLPVDTV
jgi:hypothetical protein